MMATGRRLPCAAWIGAAGLLIALLAVLAWAPWKAKAPPPAAEAPPAAARPSPMPTPTPTLRPYRGSIVDLALRFDVEEAMVHADELASDAYAGRQGGSPGGHEAASYIERQFEELGLAPAGTDGCRQPFMLPYAEEAGLPTLMITDAAGTVHDGLAFAEDYRHALGGWAAGGEAEGPVVWLGGCQSSDYDAHDVSGEIVMCRGVAGVDHAARAAAEGVSALLIVTDDERGIAIRRAIFEAPRQDGIPVLLIAPEVADLLLAVDRDDVDLGPLDAEARVAVDLTQAGEAEGANVLGALPGVDPALSDSVLVLGAHFDHIGTDPNGAVYNGANDNASGVAALLEIARTWRAANYQPGVTVLFAAWDGEEQGLLGAHHYVEHPTHPLSTTLGMIQLDMVGMADAGVLTYDGAGNAVGHQLGASAALFDVPTATVSWSGGSDHGAFLRAGVDAGLLIWDAAQVPYYHTPQDTVDTLQPERLRQAGIVASHAALALIRNAESAGTASALWPAGRSLHDARAAPPPRPTTHESADKVIHATTNRPRQVP